MKKSVQRPGAKANGFRGRWWRVTCDRPGCTAQTFVGSLHEIARLTYAGWQASRKHHAPDYCPRCKPPAPPPPPPRPRQLELFS